MKLFNTKTRELDPIDNEEMLHQALVDGTHSFEAGTTVPVTSPDGERGTVPAENIAEAVRSGFKVETPSQQVVREYVEDNKGLKGALKVGVGQFADEALLGLPELIYDKTADPLEVAKKEALKKEHDLANMAGGIVGAGASLFTGGPLWKAGAKAGEKVTAHVAEKLAASAGEEVGKRALNQTAKEIVANMAAKGAGMGVEGGVVSLPHAITEAALGDPDDAAETLLAGVGVGSLLGAGGVMAKELAKLGKEGVLKAAGMVTQQQETAKSLARKAAKVLTGVNEDDILHYLENAERVNAAPDREILKDMLDAGVSKRAAAFDAAKENLGVARRELDDAYHAARIDLAQTRAPESLADDIVGALEQQKRVLGEMSERADEALERSGLTFQKNDLVKFLDEVGSSIGVGDGKRKALISDEAVTAAAKLKAQRDRIAEAFGDEISATELRGVLREVRKDIKWNQLAGEFNDTLNKARKTFTERMSGVLKESVPEYGAHMSRMSELSQSLEQMSKAFGSKERAIGSLNSVLSPKGKVKDEMLAKFSDLAGFDFVGQLEQFKSAKALLEESRRGDIRDKLAPELFAKVKRLEAGLAEAEAAYAPVKRLSQERTQAIIRNQGFKNASIEDRRALEALSSAEGQDFLTLIKDRNVLDAFAKDGTNGSRRTLLGTIVGGALGGPAGLPLGAAAGATVDVYGGAILKKILDSNRNVSGLLFAEKAMKQAAERLDDIPAMLGRMARKERPKYARPMVTGALARLLGESVDEPKKEASTAPKRREQLDRLSEKAAVLVSNPHAAAEKLAALTGPISSGGAPGIGEAFGRKANAAMNYLYQAMPKPPRPRSPFAPKIPFVPPAHEMAAFEDKVQVATDPFSVLVELEHGTMTRAHVDAMRAIYPGLLRMIQMKVQDAVVSGVEPMAYSQRAKLSMLLGVPLDTSLTPQAVTYYQEAYVLSQAAEDQQRQGGGPSVDLADQMTTEADRIAMR